MKKRKKTVVVDITKNFYSRMDANSCTSEKARLVPIQFWVFLLDRIPICITILLTAGMRVTYRVFKHIYQEISENN